ncbi:MAG: isochorismate synthase [Akkermansiaceae bacterium]|nr:isochorismate synthase [Akkermansiaceae bacterium]
MELAMMGTGEGKILVGEGPFEGRSEPPAAGVAFYRNDFALSEAEPWRVPAKAREISDLDGILPGGAEALETDWTEPDVELFAAVFGEVTAAIRKGVIEKSVPVVTAHGAVRAGDPAGLLRALAGVEAPLRPYAWMDGETGFAGASPERLFRAEGGRLETMALAGTARREERAAFAVDEKEIREHEFVAQTMLAKLSDLGMTRRHDREIMNLGGLVHFHSPIDVELYRDERIDDLIARLHPTPALGPLPRTGETMAQLLDWRDRLQCPRWFGAPFGVMRDGVFEAIVAIRMVAWDGSALRIPSGCGVIEESRLVNEWRELRLKREAVRAVFGA